MSLVETPALGPLPETSDPELEDRLPLWVALVALFSIVLVRLPVLVTHFGHLGRFAIAGLFVGAAAWARPRCSRDRVAVGLVCALAGYLLLVGIAMFRGAQDNLYVSLILPAGDWTILAALALFGVSLSASARTVRSLQSRLVLVAFAPAAYVAVNVVLWVLRNRLPFALPVSESNAAGKKAELLSLVGVHADRISFPLAQSVNNFGAIAAAGAVAAVVVGFRTRWVSLRVALPAAAVCVYGVFATDSRGPFVYGLIAAAVVLLRPRQQFAALFVAFIPLSAIVARVVVGFLASTDVARIFARQNGDFSTGNNRFLIWDSIFHLLRHPSVDQIFGYGGFGQVPSGVVYKYAFIFSNFQDALTQGTAHNVALQAVLDTGYVGLLVLVVLSFMTLRSLQVVVRADRSGAGLGLLAVVVVMLLCGMTEALPSYILLDTLAVFVLAIAVAAGSRRHWSGTGESHPALYEPRSSS